MDTPGGAQRLVVGDDPAQRDVLAVHLGAFGPFARDEACRFELNAEAR